MKLLIVEDNRNMQAMLNELLFDLPVSILVAGDAAAAERQAALAHPDITLMDILLPDRDGLALTRDFLRNGWTRHVYMVTQCREQQYREAAAAAGAEKYFLKNNLLAVREAVQEMLRSEDDKTS